MSEVNNAEEAVKIADQFISKYYYIHKLEKVIQQDEVWVVEYDISILAPKVGVRIKLDRNTGSIIEYTKI